ncbi:ABC transporter substrate-binding protein [Candidatus Pelagibacter sp. HTCC7211]|jgi:ABC-type branched-subunit amino acid transport system substrate-binding protein|uniref:ABC transporter substrate-binding protein n=1 Tax=Pelagibacter sp. (strain HTCC7211) TaxID=439493 RepID=UPI00055663AD|nr:ABC transporter substrate-binding protein [Candidatus Pelagibacter sp. HTCC7211]
MNKLTKIIFITFISLVLLFFKTVTASEKIKIGLLVPMTGKNKDLGQSIIKAVSLAVKDIDSDLIEIIPKDTATKPNQTLRSAFELKEMGVKVVIGPIFYESITYLDEMKDLTFLSLTNKTLDLPKNVISAGINSTSQLNTIKKFLEKNNIQRTIFLTPIQDFEFEVKRGIKNSKIKIFKDYVYNSDPTKLTSQIEEITNYKIRKQNLEDEIYRIKKSNETNKEKKIKKLEKRYSLGGLNFDAVIIADFDESLKSVATSLLYTDVSPKNKYFITLNQWFDQSLLNETDIQPVYYPSINKNNFNNYKDKFYKEFKEYPSHLTLLSYDLVGLVYYLSLKTNLSNLNKLFKKKNSFKGKIGIFDIKNNKINHRLNFYKIEDKKIIEIF